MKKIVQLYIAMILCLMMLSIVKNANALYGGGYVSNMGYGYAGSWNISRYYSTVFTVRNAPTIWSGLPATMRVLGPSYKIITDSFYKPYPGSYQLYQRYKNPLSNYY